MLLKYGSLYLLYQYYFWIKTHPLQVVLGVISYKLCAFHVDCFLMRVSSVYLHFSNNRHALQVWCMILTEPFFPKVCFTVPYCKGLGIKYSFILFPRFWLIWPTQRKRLVLLVWDVILSHNSWHSSVPINFWKFFLFYFGE